MDLVGEVEIMEKKNLKGVCQNSAFRYGGTRVRDRQQGKGLHTP